VWREGARGGIPGGKPVVVVRINSVRAISSCWWDLGPDWGLRSQVRDRLEEAGSLTGGGGAGQDGMFEGLWGLRAQRAGRVGIRVVP